jgi:Holliday junction resolvase RusA-like endonuclease
MNVDFIKKLKLLKIRLLLEKGYNEKRIVPFDEEFYNKLSNTFINDIPVSIEIKYLRPTVPPGRCMDRSLYMFFCFDNALLVRGNNLDLELRYGISNGNHGWIEIGDYVYDPSLLMRFEKKTYYDIYRPSNVFKKTLEEYCMDKSRRKLYEEIKSATINDFLPHGSKRIELAVTIPLIRGIAKNSSNLEFNKDLDNYLKLIQYDEEEIYNELNSLSESIFKNNTFEGFREKEEKSKQEKLDKNKTTYFCNEGVTLDDLKLNKSKVYCKGARTPKKY